MPATLLALPARGLVLYPGMIRAFPVGRPGSVAAVHLAVDTGTPLVMVVQHDPAVEDPRQAILCETAIELHIEQVVDLPDGTVRVLAEAMRRVRRVSPLAVDPSSGAWIVEVDDLNPPDEDPVMVAALAAEASHLHREWLLGTGMTEADHDLLISTPEEQERLADQMCGILEIGWPIRLQLLDTAPLTERFRLLIAELSVAIARQKIQADIQGLVQTALDKHQKEFHIKEQIKALRAELGEGGGEAEADRFLERVAAAGLPDDARKEAEREITRLRRVPTDSSEYNIARTWLETLLEVPWSTSTPDVSDLAAATEILEADHHGLDKVKERILEYLAVRQLRDDAKGAVLCFVGAPGVGKTSLGRSIARSMGRKFARLSLGGIKDEAEIRGHRRTYIGAMPGRIVRALIRAGSNNPVIVLDEIDKLGNDFRGDPASALLEVLDPEQNGSFVDHYLDVGVDLSNVLFVATANLQDPIPHALHDRFEVIEIPGYTEEEKTRIARQFLLPRLAQEHGLEPRQLRLDAGALTRVIREYTREAGVRDLNRQLAALLRKVARKVVSGGPAPKRLTAAAVARLLGTPRFREELDDRDDTPGVVIGLAWTAAGGDILFVEALSMPGSEGLKLTGALGEVMKESAQAALSWIRANHSRLGLDAQVFEQLLHLHVPAGAIPKDGPSAGVSMLTALASRLLERPVRPKLAMTGEITLRGRVLAVGGVKEKILAARRAGITSVILPRQNAADLDDLPADVRHDVEFHLVDTADEVIALALDAST